MIHANVLKLTQISPIETLFLSFINIERSKYVFVANATRAPAAALPLQEICTLMFAQPTTMEECCIDNRKLSHPIPVDSTESYEEHALVFYATESILEIELCGQNYHHRVRLRPNRNYKHG